MLEVINLVKEYKQVTAVDNLSFKILPGRIFGLLGPNGAGKTTTIRIILDIIKPTSGEIRFNNKLIDSTFQEKTGYLPEERGLYRKSKVIDVINYFSRLKGISASELTKKADEWLNKLEVSGYRNKKIEELSKGNQQKIQFIISILHDPEVLILDEPFTGFDPINQQLIKDLILDFAKEKKIIILSTHQMDIAEKMCNDILLINKGKEVCSGNISEVKKQFGFSSIKIDFEGDGEKLKNLHGVKKFDGYQNHAEIELQKDVNPSQFLKIIVQLVAIKNFSVIEPTLNKIFIDVIKRFDTVYE